MAEATSVTVEREIAAPAHQLFDLLCDPQRHVEVDGSGFVRGLDSGDRLEMVGQTFRMNMSGDHMGGDYRTDNLVTGFDPGRLLAWKTAPAGTEPPGWEWRWELEERGTSATVARLTYDWGQVTDPELLAAVQFPLVTRHQLEDSLARLAEAAAGG